VPLLQLEFFHALLVWRDGRALDTDIVLENRLVRLDHNLIIGLGKRAWRIRRDSRVWVGTQIGIVYVTSCHRHQVRLIELLVELDQA